MTPYLFPTETSALDYFGFSLELLKNNPPVDLRIPEAEVVSITRYYDDKESAILFDRLKSGIKWTQDFINIQGKHVPLPRLTFWCGEPDTYYSYSGINNRPQPWTPLLSEIRDRINRDTNVKVNSVLCNFYRHGSNSIGWHSDDEPELGAEPSIASLSLGATRRFILRAKGESRRKYEIYLGSGDLLLMGGKTQINYEHSVPKERLAAERINLTFRRVIHGTNADN